MAQKSIKNLLNASLGSKGTKSDATLPGTKGAKAAADIAKLNELQMSKDRIDYKNDMMNDVVDQV